MNEKIEVPTMKVPPLKKICMTIGQLPASYVETMSYYEMLVWFVNYLRDDIIPVVNANGEATRELQELYVELQEYVNNYFDNLDVQEEINNKLDEMASDGTLEEIISTYLNTKALLVFDNVDDMKSSVNLIVGSYAKTLGYHTKGDKGGYIYKIRETTLSDVTSYQNIILDDESLCAELILETNYVTPEMFGAYGNYTTDDYTPIQNAFDYAVERGLTLYFQKNYYMSKAIKVPSQLTRGNQTNNIINITGNANPEWTFQNRTDRVSKIKVNDHFMTTDVTINTSSTTSLANISGDIGNLTLECTNTSTNHYIFNCILFSTSKIHDITSKSFAGVLYGGLSKVTHIQNNQFLSCYGTCFESFETGTTLFTDCYIHDNYINGGSSSTHGNLFAHGNGHSFFLDNNYIDFFNFMFKTLPNSGTFNQIHSTNNCYDVFIRMNADRDGSYDWHQQITGFRQCSFINDRFGTNHDAFSGYLPDVTRTIFDVSNYATFGLNVIGCEITDSTPCLFHSTNALYYVTANGANFKRLTLIGNQCIDGIYNQFNQLIQCSPANERGQFTLRTDMIDNVTELPAGTQFNGRRVIYDGNLYEYYGGWKTIYNV